MSIPRRIRVDLNTPAELAIRNAVQVVEEAGADPLLTDAVVLLDEARSKVADYVDSQMQKGGALPDGFKLSEHECMFAANAKVVLVKY